MTVKPEPQPRDVICSVCGLDWTQHQRDETGEVSLMECVRLLKVELIKRPQARTMWANGGIVSSGGIGDSLSDPRP